MAAATSLKLQSKHTTSHRHRLGLRVGTGDAGTGCELSTSWKCWSEREVWVAKQSWCFEQTDLVLSSLQSLARSEQADS